MKFTKVSPPSEHIQGGQWWTRYQPVSYQLSSRSGNRDQFIDMVNRCNNAGVMVIADLVINHMTGHGASGSGVGGSGFDGNSLVIIFFINVFSIQFLAIYHSRATQLYLLDTMISISPIVKSTTMGMLTRSEIAT